MTQITEVPKPTEAPDGSGFRVDQEQSRPLGTEGYRSTPHGGVITATLIAVVIAVIYLIRDPQLPIIASATLGAVLVIIIGGMTYALFGQKTTAHKIVEALTSVFRRKD